MYIVRNLISKTEVNTMSENLKILIPQDERAEAQDLLETLGGMNEAEKKDMLVFLQGVAFGRMLAERQAG